MAKLHFIKVMDQDYSQYMIIPRMFVRELREELFANVSLKFSKGSKWHVRLVKKGDNLFFIDGWKKFVEANHIRKGDSLVFKYEGNSCFSVLLMFDTSGCEKNVAFSVNCPEESQLEEDVSDCFSARATCDDTYEGLPSIAAVQSKRKKRHEGKLGVDGSFTGGNTMFLPRGLRGKSEVKVLKKGSRAWKLAEAFKPANPSFTVQMQSHNMSRMLVVPMDFASIHLHPEPQPIKLRVPNVKRWWHADYRFNNRSSGFRGQHWTRFCKDNKLEDGDVCVFELSGTPESVAFDVHIFQADDRVLISERKDGEQLGDLSMEESDL